MPQPVEGSPEWIAQDKGPSILAICWTVTAISTFFVAGRLYVRAKIKGRLQSDDYYTLLALICGYISTALSTVAVSYGNGRHFSLLTVEQKQGAILWTTAGFCPGVLSFGLPKMAVVALLTRLLNPSRFHKWFLWGICIWCQLTLFATIGVLLGRCKPARSLWDFSVEGTCFDNNILVHYCMYAGAYSAFVDIYLAVYPTIVLYKLQLSLKKKLALCVALGVGSISGIVAIYKTTRIPSLGSPDFSYDTSDLVIWTVIEGSTIIIACSIPILQPLLELVLRRNPFASSQKESKLGPRFYEDYSEQSKSGIELGQRKPKSKAMDDLGLTIVADDDSQENILIPTQGQECSYSSSNNENDSKDNKKHRASHPVDGTIVRTDVVTVEYEPRTARRDTVGSQRWRVV